MPIDPRVSVFRSVPAVLGEGAVWHPARQSLFWVDILGRKIHETGPDGCTIDIEGNLWIAHWSGWGVTRWDPVRGRLLDTLRLPAAQVTTCTFGGPQLDTFFITTASCKLTDAERQAQPEAGFVFAANVGTRGFSTDVFAG